MSRPNYSQEKLMRNIKKHLGTLPVVVVCLLVLGSAVTFAQKRFMLRLTGRPEVKVLLSGVVERDKGLVSVEEAGTVKSGEVMNWTITSMNQGSAPAHDYKAIGTVPPGTQFVAGSVTADNSAKVTYSIDNGVSFSDQPTIEEKQPDGSTRKVPAPASMYTRISYEWADPLDQGAKLNATYKVRLK
jgi:uncharacterized repeat protein (TIGR01451 family)